MIENILFEDIQDDNSARLDSCESRLENHDERIEELETPLSKPVIFKRDIRVLESYLLMCQGIVTPTTMTRNMHESGNL